MKKKILTYMMTAIFMLGCAGLSTPMTAYANDGSCDPFVMERHDFGTGETHVYTVPGMTAEEAREAHFRRCRRLGMSEADIQADWDRYHGSSSTANSTASANASSVQTEATPSYTQEQIDAAWQEINRTASTCTENGVITYKNSLTGKTKTEKMDLVAHTYELSSHEDATCIAEGVDTYTCTVCGNSYTETTPVIDHVYKLTHEDATCTHEGVDTYTCTVCGDSYTETIPMTDHIPGKATVTKKAKLFSEGESAVFCTECNKALSVETIPQICPLTFKTVLEIVGISLTVLVGIVAAIVLHNNKNKTSNTEDKVINEVV